MQLSATRGLKILATTPEKHRYFRRHAQRPGSGRLELRQHAAKRTNIK
jgi:hypothetical protein